MGIRHLSGSPWHKERVHREEGDDRRYKGRCQFFSYKDEYCNKYAMRCFGSAHCSGYVALSEDEFKRKQRENQKSKGKNKPKGDDEFYYR